MTTTTASAALVPTRPVFSNTERLALAGFLAAHSGLTRQAYELDLRQYAGWCQQHHLRLFQARRPISRTLPATSRPAAVPGQPSPAASAPSQGATVMPTCGLCRPSR
jgi:hypothetical protein